ncbi:MAG TPA: hypothetical protein VJ888_06885, partial [Mobilitalea sp.]|nr:hypothetical protein [Mobilitalea sp.]
MKKNRVIISIIYLLLLVTIIVVVIAARQNKYSTYLVMNNDGYLISQNVLTKNLLNDEIDFASADCEGIPFYTSDIVYEKSGKYYLSDDKVPINDIYPLFINSASTTMSLTGNMSLVSDDFERAQAYSGLYINEGISFNEDMERAYREEFILLSLSNGLFVNVKTMNITGNFFIEKSIPTNSIIRFMENEIRYYSLKNDVLSLNSIEPCGSTTKVIIDQMEYSYFDFLERLGIYEKAALREKEKEAMGDEFPPAIVEATPTPQTNSLINNGDQSADKSSTESEDKNIIGGRISYEEEEFEPSIDEATPTPKVGAKPSKKPDKESLPEGEEIPKPTGIAQNNSSDNEEYSDKAPSPAKPAAEALPADLPELVSTSDNTVNDDPDLQDDPEDPEDEDDTGNPEWKKPEVFLNDFITSVYAIKSPQMVIENSEFLYRSGVSFNVYEGSRLIIRKAYGASSDVNIAPLKPDTDYKVIATMEYFNKFGVRETESIIEVNLHTKSLSDLEPLRFNWSNGELFYNKIQLAELTITNAVSSINNTTDDEGNTVQSNSYIETVQFMNRIEVIITAKEDSSLSYTIPITSVNLKDLKNGNSILYESGGRIKSNTEYYYEFICYDRYGNLLPMEGVVRGTTHTCKQPPVANITVLKNEIKNVEVRVSIDNVDGAEIVDGSILFCIYDRDNSPVMTTISLKDNEGNYSGTETSIMHSIPYEGATIKFLDLLDYEVFNFQVYSSYYINDGHGLYELAPIGRTKLTTMPISALGFAFFNIEFNEIIDNSATFTLSLDRKRTDSRLLSLISGIDVSILRDDTKESDGIKLLYGSKDEVFLEVINGELPDNNGLISFTEEELENMKLGDVEDKDISFTFHAANLQSITKYDIAIIPRVLMGSTENSVYRDIKAFYSPDAFTTMKKTAVIDIDAIYASRDFIKLYGVSINDPDGAIISFPVTMDVYDDANSKIASFEITSMDKVPVFDVSKLKKDKAYTFRFFASEYNNGTDAKDMRTYRKNHELYYSELSESKQYLVVSTREAVSGSIDLQEMNRNKIIDRVEIPAKDITSHTSGVSLYQGFRLSSNSRKLAKYSMEVDFGNQQWNSFQIGYSYIAMTTYSIYLEDPDLNPEAQPIATKTVEDRTRSADYSRWTDIEFFDNDINISGKQTIYLVAKVNTGGIHCLWGVRFMNTKQSDSEHYYANLKALVDDTNNELGSIPSYKIKVYEDGVWIDTRRHEWTMNSDGTTTLRMYQVAGDKTETLVDIKIFSGEERICDTDFYYEVSRGHHTYVFELWVIVFDYEIKLDQEELTTELEIIGIRTADDLANVRYGTDRETKYYVINDIIYPLGWNNITASLPLHAELDFRGHTLIYNSSSQLITTIGSHGSLKNMVLEYAEGWGSDTWRSTSYLVTYNYGTIQNQLVNYTNGNKEPHDYRSGSALVYTNYESGTIENFVINYKDSLVSTNGIAGACVYNRGMVRNGYVYGEPIKMTKREYLFDREYSNNLIVGGVVAANRQSGNVENVYSLVDIETRDVLSANDYAFCVVGLNDGTLLNSFSTGDVLYGGVVRQDLGPAYRNRYSANMVRNTYYYSEVDYGNTNNILIAKLLLYDLNWYDRMFNREKSSRKGQFNLKPLQMGYFPHVIWPSFMPEQEYNPLPVLIEEDEIKIIDTSIIEQENNYAIALITFDNPDNFEVSEIKTQWLNTEIISQFNDDGFYRVTVRLTQALDTKYYSDYEITSFIYKFGLTGSSWNKEFAAGEGPTIPAEFYKPIITVSDWNSIKNDYYQNYRLHADLDFQYLAQEVAVLPANLNLATTDSKFKIDAFNGKLDGNNHKISFVDTGDYGYVIGKLLGSVRDLDVAYLDVRDGDGRYKGFIGRMLEGSSVDNVHILGMDAISYEHCGAIAGDVYAGTITNSSAHNINIVSTADGNYTQFIGGLVGKHRVSSANTNYANLVIENSYINGINIETKRAGDCGGVGGLVGYIRAGAEISNVYVVNGVIDTVFKNAGGLIGSIDTFTNSDSEFYMLKDYYVDVDITTNTERAGGIIGFSSVKNAEKEEHGLTLGNISTNKYSEDVSELEVGRYYGSYPPKTPKEIEEEIGAKTIYGYEYSVLNGIINPRNPEGILTEERLLTYAQLCDIDTYGIDGELYWEADFIRDDEEQAAGILPKLKAIGREESLPDPEESDSEKLLPYQEDYYLENNPITVKSISSTPYQSGELFYVDIELVHSSDILVNDADFNGLMIADLAGAEESFSVDVTDTGTVLHYVLGINGYYDTYYLTGINYTLSEAPLKQSMYLSVGITPQFLEIGAVDQWNSLMSSDMHGLKGYNVRITGDLDFNINGRNAKTNVIVNRLVGGNEITKTIKGITINGGDSFVAAAQGEVSYLNFEDINITKDMASAPELINSVGIFAAIIGDMHDVDFTNITIDADCSAYTGLVGLGYGMYYNNTLQNITVKGGSFRAGQVPGKGAVGGLVARLSGSGGMYDNTATNMIVEGRTYVGGLLGIQEEGRYLWNNEVNNAVVSSLSATAAYNYVGGIAGAANDTALSNIGGNNRLNHSVVLGSNYVGGLIGLGSMMGDYSLTGTTAENMIENDKYSSTAEQVFVAGIGSYVGGIAGQGVVRRTEVRDADIYGILWIGGVTGNGSVYYASVTDATIGTVYDRNAGDTGNMVFRKKVEDKIEYYRNLKDMTLEDGTLAVYTETINLLQHLITTARTGSWSNAPLGSTNNSRIGGIAGRTIAVANAIVANSRIGSYNANAVGGIVGITQLSSYNTGGYRIISSGTMNCEIYGADDIGGIVGTHYRAYIESCYSNSNVTATRKNAGGIAGRVNDTALYSITETPRANHVYYAGTVTAPENVAGIFGLMEQPLYSTNEGWLMAGNVVVTNSEKRGNYFYNRYQGDSQRITLAMVY